MHIGQTVLTVPSDAQDRRINRRRRVLKGAAISPDGSNIVFDCTLRNLSEEGARIHVESQIGIPAAFRLVCSDENIDVAARVVWRGEHDLGVRYN